MFDDSPTEDEMLLRMMESVLTVKRTGQQRDRRAKAQISRPGQGAPSLVLVPSVPAGCQPIVKTWTGRTWMLTERL